MITAGGCVSSEQVANGVDRWFECWDEVIGDDQYSEDERAFLAALRSRAISRNWRCDPGDTFSYNLREIGEHGLEVGVSLDDPVSHTGLFAFGLVFDDGRIVGNRIDPMEPFGFEPLKAAAMEFVGPLPSLVERAGEWCEMLLDWPIERREWFDRRGDVIYREWVLSDLGEQLTIAAPRPKPLLRRPNRIELVRGVRR